MYIYVVLNKKIIKLNLNLKDKVIARREFCVKHQEIRDLHILFNKIVRGEKNINLLPTLKMKKLAERYIEIYREKK